jgi:hypothetical protein
MDKTLVQKEITSQGEVVEVFFDVTLIVNKENKIIIVDNTQEDFYDYLDCGTLTCQRVKIQVC